MHEERQKHRRVGAVEIWHLKEAFGRQFGKKRAKNVGDKSLQQAALVRELPTETTEGTGAQLTFNGPEDRRKDQLQPIYGAEKTAGLLFFWRLPAHIPQSALRMVIQDFTIEPAETLKQL